MASPSILSSATYRTAGSSAARPSPRRTRWSKPRGHLRVRVVVRFGAAVEPVADMLGVLGVVIRPVVADHFFDGVVVAERQVKEGRVQFRQDVAEALEGDLLPLVCLHRRQRRGA